MLVCKPETGLTFVVRRLRRDTDRLVELPERRRAQPTARDRQHLVRRVGAAQRRQHRDQAADAGPRLRVSCVAVEFRTHFFNFASRTAIERLGAKLDGILRSHQLVPDGSRRDTVVYSILDVEWPTVRTICSSAWTAHASRRDCGQIALCGIRDLPAVSMRVYSASTVVGMLFWPPPCAMSILRGFARSASGIVTVSTPFS